jgi:hypothetical protein
MVAGSSNRIGNGSTFYTHSAGWCVKGWYANGEVMQLVRTIFGRRSMRRAMAVLACAVLLYFAAGGSLLHQHTNGPENACHVCQSLHAPVLAAAALDLVAVPELIARYSSLPQHAAPSNSFSLHRASRAPPSA